MCLDNFSNFGVLIREKNSPGDFNQACFRNEITACGGAMSIGGMINAVKQLSTWYVSINEIAAITVQ